MDIVCQRILALQAWLRFRHGSVLISLPHLWFSVKTEPSNSIPNTYCLSIAANLSPLQPPPLPPPPPSAWIFGDPHLVTLDGFKYTFNGKGEFTLVGTQNNLLTVQGRMQQFGSRSATVLTAIAAKELYSDTVMVARSRRGIDAYLNGERVDLSVITRQEFRNVSVVRENNSIVTVEFSCGARISVQVENDFLSAISVVLPPSFKGDDNTKGLLGIYNGNSSDDLKPQNALSSLASNSSTERIHNLFGLTCECMASVCQPLCVYKTVQVPFSVTQLSIDCNRSP